MYFYDQYSILALTQAITTTLRTSQSSWRHVFSYLQKGQIYIHLLILQLCWSFSIKTSQSSCQEQLCSWRWKEFIHFYLVDRNFSYFSLHSPGNKTWESIHPFFTAVIPISHYTLSSTNSGEEIKWTMWLFMNFPCEHCVFQPALHHIAN